MRTVALLTIVALWGALPFVNAVVAADDEQSKAQPLLVDWKDGWLSIRNERLPNADLVVGYIEAFCRPGSTAAHFWTQTLIPQKTERLADTENGKTINLISRLQDGVEVKHRITSTADEVLFHLVAENPTKIESQAHWGQACIRVGHFTGRDEQTYLPNCFVFIDGKLKRLPTHPWATEAQITPGQVYCPRHVPRSDVNPRPLSTLVPSSGLIGCYSADDKWILATAFEPYQELFQGVFGCIHSDLRIGGLKAGEKKEIRGKIYLIEGDAKRLVARYERDFPEHLEKVTAYKK